MESSVRFNQHILDHIADIHPLVETLIQSKLNHSTERFTMPIHQCIDGSGLSPPNIQK
jgi:hypothetical protein